MVGLQVEDQRPWANLEHITGCTSLETLDLSYQSHLNGNWHLLERLPELRSLDMSHCDLPVFPHELSRLSKLSHLDLRFNRSAIYGIDHVKKIPSLRDICYSKTNRLVVPRCLTSLSIVEPLLPADYVKLCVLSHLRALHLSFDARTPLPDVLPHMTFLTHLALTGPYRGDWESLRLLPRLSTLSLDLLEPSPEWPREDVLAHFVLVPGLRNLLLRVPRLRNYDKLAALPSSIETVSLYLDSPETASIDLLDLRQRSSNFDLTLLRPSEGQWEAISAADVMHVHEEYMQAAGAWMPAHNLADNLQDNLQDLQAAVQNLQAANNFDDMFGSDEE